MGILAPTPEWVGCCVHNYCYNRCYFVNLQWARSPVAIRVYSIVLLMMGKIVTRNM